MGGQRWHLVTGKRCCRVERFQAVLCFVVETTVSTSVWSAVWTDCGNPCQRLLETRFRVCQHSLQSNCGVVGVGRFHEMRWGCAAVETTEVRWHIDAMALLGRRRRDEAASPRRERKLWGLHRAEPGGSSRVALTAQRVRDRHSEGQESRRARCQGGGGED